MTDIGRERHCISWLINETVGQPYFDNLFGELCQELRIDGVPIDRGTVHIRTLHPQFMGATVLWEDGMSEASMIMFGHAALQSEAYLQSPIRPLFEGRLDEIRKRFDDRVVEDEEVFNIFADLKEQGFTDYIIMPLMFVSGTRHACSWATKLPGGFSEDVHAYLHEIRPLLAMVMEIRLNRRIAKNLLNTYVGERAGERILAGQITRGSGETVRAAIWHCDLRGFTMLSEKVPRDEVIASLNAYFDVMAAPVLENGGEILKFIGDAMLAIFPLETDGACSRAFSAAMRARRDMHELNEQRRAEGKDEIGFGLSLHVGDVMYGNIGAATRLDFTVIGAAVNTAARLEELTKELRRELVMSGQFANLCEGTKTYLERIGSYQLRGVIDEIEVFAPPEDW